MDTENTNDDKAMPPASAGSHGEHGQAMFSERSSMAVAAERWCDQIGVSPVAFNVVTALFRLGLVQKPQPTLTDEERAALWCAVCDYNSMTRTMHMPKCGKIGPALARLFERLK